jgi:hypothetical protein
MNAIPDGYHPKLRTDSFFLPGPDGTYFHNARGWYKLTSKIPYGLVERVIPHFDGTRSVATITQPLTDPQRQAVTFVLKELRDHGFVRDDREDLPALDAHLERRYAAELAFLEACGDRPRERFQRFRHARVLIDGGVIAAPVLELLWDLGLRHAAWTGGDDTALQALIGARRTLDPEQGLTLMDERATIELREYDLVVQLSADPVRARALAHRALEAGVPVVQGVLFQDDAWVQTPDSASPDAVSFWERLEAVTTRDEPQVALIERDLGFVGDAKPAAVRYERATLESTKHRVSAHALSQMAQPTRAARTFLETLSTVDAVNDEGFSRRAAKLIDPKLGVLSELDERDHVQLPLNVSEAVARDARGGMPFRVLGVGTEFTTPRLRATRRALELYAATAVDVRRFGNSGGHPSLWAFELTTREPVQIAATLAVPTLNGASPLELSGLASGFTWDDAVQAALVGLLEDETTRRASREPLAISPLGESLLLDDEPSRRFLEMLRLMHFEVELGLVASDTPMAQCLISLDGRAVALNAHADARLAVRGALEQGVRFAQSRLNAQPALAPASLEGWRSPRRLESRQSLPGAVADPTGCLVRHFAVQGQRVCVVPLDHDPAVRSTGLIVVHGLLIQEEA